MAESSDEWFAEHLTSLNTGVFDAQALANEKAELIAERGEADGEAIYDQEYMCSWSAALPGAYYARVIDKLEKDGAITRVPYDPSRQVHTAWDLGANDMTVIWFFQKTPFGWNVIDYLANTSVGIDWYVKEVRDKPYVYGEHLLPHDAEDKRVTNVAAASIEEQVIGLGLRNVRVVPRTSSVANDINEVRKILPICTFDKEKCAHGLDALRAYRRQWDEKLRAYKDHPLHDWASDPSDAFRTFAMGKPNDVQQDARPMKLPVFGAV